MADGTLVLRPGDRNALVGEVQQQLDTLGSYALDVDNIFGPATEAAVRDFQSRSGLPVTGVVDDATWRRLFNGQPLPAEVLSAAPPAGAARTFAATGGYSVQVNLADRTLTLLRDSTVQSVFPVAIGKPATPTPPGNYTILNKALNPGGPFGTRWLGLTSDGIGIHGTNAPASIGLAVSNGCIRMHNQDVESIFPVLNVGDPVRIVTGQAAGNTYMVESGDTLASIAQRFGTTVEALRQANALTSDFVYPGEVLFIPGISAPPAPPPPSPGPPPAPGPGTTTYVVKPGETLYLIARQFGTTLAELRRLNRLTGDVINAGQTLVVPAPATAQTYTARPGDTLFSIAERFGTTVAALRQLNNLTSDTIQVGQVLRVR